MQSLVAASSAATWPLRAGGRTFHIGKMRLKHYAKIQAKLASEVPDPIARIAESAKALDKDSAKHLLDRAFDLSMKPPHARVSMDDVLEFIFTTRGLVYSAWLLFQDADPSVTLEWVEEAFSSSTDEELSAAFLTISKAASPTDATGDETDPTKGPHSTGGESTTS